LNSKTRKAFNNIFIKDVPTALDSVEGVLSLFNPFGTIASHYHNQTSKGNYYFLCFGNSNKEDKEYGPRCAEKAFEEMHGKLLPGAEKPLYVSPGMTRGERNKVNEHEFSNFKISKKRCNLFVKNFPNNTTEDHLRQLFEPFG
jgi:polyadenylate-binding protein